MELISVIVPVYNIQSYIGDCLESIRRQSCKNIEVLIVDDGSTDSSGKICDKFACLDERFKVFHKKHEGLSAAREYGIDKAKGEYYVFVDGDDQIALNLVSYLHEMIIETGAQIGICDLLHCYEGSQINYKKETNRIVYDSDDAITHMLYQKSFLVSFCGKIYNKECFAGITFPRDLLFEDSAVMCQIIDKAEKVVYSNARLYAYIHRENTITTREFSDRDIDILVIGKQILKYLKNRDVELRKAAYVYFINSCMRVFLNIPREKRYSKVIYHCENSIKKGRWKCILNPKVRMKLKASLILFSINKNLLFQVYKKVDRWS